MVGKVTPMDRVSASQMPALFNCSPYTTPNGLLRSIRNWRDGIPDEYTAGEAAEWGNTFEPHILEKAAERLRVRDLETIHPKPFFADGIDLAASLDASAYADNILIKTDVAVFPQGMDEMILNGPGVIEAKLTSYAPELFPPPWRGPIQLQAQLLCTGWSWGCVATLYRGIDLRLALYERDEEIINEIKFKLSDFYNRLEKGDVFPLEGSKDGVIAYPQTKPDAPEVMIPKTGLHADALKQLVEATDRKKIAEAEIDEAQAILMNLMGMHDSAYGLIGNQRYRLKWPTRSYKATPEKITPAKPARTIRQATISFKAIEG